MYLMITAYDSMGDLFVRVNVVDETENSPIETRYRRHATIPNPPFKDAEGYYRDALAAVAEEALNMAYRED